MTVTFGTNIGALGIQRNLDSATATLGNTYERLASGQRINKASDDAAGLAISMQLNTQARVFAQAVRNVNDGISYVNIMQGSLAQLSNINQRQLELSEQAANGVYSTQQRTALNTEAQSLSDEYNRIVASTKFNGVQILANITSPTTIQAGTGSANALAIPVPATKVWSGTFQTPVQYPPASGSGSDVAVGDFNHDGNLDFVTGNALSANLNLYLNNGDGTFGAGISIDVGNNTPIALASGDFNGDGYADIVVNDYTYGNAIVLLNNGNGTFKQQTLAGGNFTFSMVLVADLNGDGKDDFVTADNGSQTFSVFLANGDGSFSDRVSYDTVYNPGFAIGDMNGDGLPDIITTDTSEFSQQVNIFLNQGHGTFALSRTFAASNTMNTVCVADVNDDGIMDIVGSSWANSFLSVYLGNSNGTFKAVQTYDAGGSQHNFERLADFNGDGLPDVLLSHYGAANTQVMLNDGKGGFSIAYTSPTNTGSWGIAAADLNNDGVLDIISNNYTLGSFVHLANTRLSVPTLPHFNLRSVAGAKSALTALNANLVSIASWTSLIGAAQSRLQIASATASVSGETALAANSRIVDADIASESATAIKTEISRKVTAALLGQVNQQSRIALDLLRHT
jgi:flagellin-like hook-associated protein FlgL